MDIISASPENLVSHILPQPCVSLFLIPAFSQGAHYKDSLAPWKMHGTFVREESSGLGRI
jgi:hypothetical protein